MRRALRVVGGAAPEPEDEPDTTVLLAAVAGGDLDAFGRLYDDLAPLVFGVARRVVRDPARAEEVAQEVFTELWRQAARFDASRGSVRTWASTIAHRRAVDAVRSTEASRAREDHVARREPVDVAGPEDAIVTAAEHEGVRRCLESLTPLQSQAVRLAYYQGFTYPEVAQLLDRPLSTVKTRMRDGLIRLRDCLEAGHGA
ncbi:RNA polymerase sigma-70 factor (ECF subfamily) [Nocardioides luteus]|uniref:RNA polymerase sigma factor SigK n=1 Tax=Nocardioides luteus TaxID=1844 RepID=A0ABQ5STI6_9ACTN|nr:ECF RNA polymerase sigma factor SigK [Nocardioides luteus]MDR7309977.1 RNA polymerase sigma-70 factor (ECF subfamily) [Nocardioides luteus]GGR59220.1 RNA polymerase sigma factor SigK [Nocardioides luteus]GLJ67114.1 RNA polymerase sigma factor SigK [Nocardioides luteus]